MAVSLGTDGFRLARIAALTFSAALGLAAAGLMFEASIQDGVQLWDVLRTLLILVTTAWLAWGTMQALLGLPPRRTLPERGEIGLPHAPTVVLVPICNEDPVATFARIAAMDASLDAAGVNADIAILSDTRDDTAATRERDWFARLLAERHGDGRIFYRRREVNTGRKAGNIEDFIRKSGGGYEFAVILDADSLMEGATIREMIARMEAEPELGLLQTLPKIVGAQSLFGRAMQFSASFFSPVFARGLARMQGRTGPFWGHNAIVRVRAFAESCGLPSLSGRPPFGGHILSHDYVEAALLARAGWKVRVDEDIEGSFEEGPENVVAFARRDRRWCQGNLQHSRLIFAPGLKGWSRFVFVQGILAYVSSLIWGAFLIVSIVAAVTAPAPDYFPDTYQLFPVFPDDRTKQIVGLAIGIVGLLLLPKVAILTESALNGRAAGFGGRLSALRSVLCELLLSSLLAPVMLMYQSRAVLQVLTGRDGGWPANQRGEGRLSLSDAWRASAWISVVGAASLAASTYLAPELLIWLMPVSLPMVLAPMLIAWSSQPAGQGVFRVPQEDQAPAVVAAYRDIHGTWAGHAAPEDTGTGGRLDAAA